MIARRPHKISASHGLCKPNRKGEGCQSNWVHVPQEPQRKGAGRCQETFEGVPHEICHKGGGTETVGVDIRVNSTHESV